MPPQSYFFQKFGVLIILTTFDKVQRHVQLNLRGVGLHSRFAHHKSLQLCQVSSARVSELVSALNASSAHVSARVSASNALFTQ